LPDGTSITIGTPLVKCPEMYFKPSDVGFDIQGLPDIIQESVESCKGEMKSEL